VAGDAAALAYGAVTEQARRISACNFTFFTDGRLGTELQRKGAFIEGSISVIDVLSEQPSLWQERVLLNETFFRELSAHPVPVSEAVTLDYFMRDYVAHLEHQVEQLNGVVIEVFGGHHFGMISFSRISFAASSERPGFAFRSR
jgi:hypothetical protein